QRGPVWVAALGRLALSDERTAQIAVSDGRFGDDGKGVGPKFLGVMPDVDLVPGENSQAHEDTDGRAAKEEARGVPTREQAGTGYDGPPEPGQAGIRITS